MIARSDADFELGAGDVKTAQFPVVALGALQVLTCRGRRPGPCEQGDAPAVRVRVTIGGIAVPTDAQGRALVRQLPAGQIPVAVDPSTVPAGWAAPRPTAVDLPESPTTLPLSIRLTPVALTPAATPDWLPSPALGRRPLARLLTAGGFSAITGLGFHATSHRRAHRRHYLRARAVLHARPRAGHAVPARTGFAAASGATACDGGGARVTVTANVKTYARLSLEEVFGSPAASLQLAMGDVDAHCVSPATAGLTCLGDATGTSATWYGDVKLRVRLAGVGGMRAKITGVRPPGGTIPSGRLLDGAAGAAPTAPYPIAPATPAELRTAIWQR